MKKNVRTFAAALTAVVLFSMSAAGCRPNSASAAASGETKTALENVLKKLEDNSISFSLTYGDYTAEDVYNTAKSAAPELDELEGKEDSGLALLELYEEYCNKLNAYDYTAMLQRMKRGVEEPEEYPWRYEDAEGYEMWMTPKLIEGLLAQKVFFEKLDAAQRERFCKCCSDIYGIVFPATREVFGYNEHLTFADLGGTELMEDFELLIDESVTYRKLDK